MIKLFLNYPSGEGVFYFVAKRAKKPMIKNFFGSSAGYISRVP
jgi:hypothetical protein